MTGPIQENTIGQGDRRMRFPDGLRAIAAMLVILPHAAGLLAYWQAPSAFTRAILFAVPLGSCGVQIFFVLSGFVIAYSLRRARFSSSYIANFILRRSIRLDPPYWAAILLYLGFIALRRRVGHDPLPYPSGAKLLAHFFYAQDVLGYGDINVVFWTLCVEIQLYVTFCLLLWLVQALLNFAPQMRPLARAPFFILFILSLAWPAGVITDGLYPGSFVPYWYAFLAGAVIWWIAGKELPRWIGYAAILALWLLAAAKENLALATVALTASMLLFSCSGENLYRWLGGRSLQFLGRLSYCIYLVHVPISLILLGALARVAPRHEAISYLFLLALIVLTIALAYLMHLFVERPALRWSRLLKPQLGKSVSL